MGIPALFRWLSNKYPRVTSQVIEEQSLLLEDGQTAMPIDSSRPNPNGVEFDNLYLDMNGIIHPCCHPEDKKAPETEDEMMVEVFAYIDRIFRLIRPRKLLYMAIDGVAPRAKMNQQRSRRFRAAQEEQIKRDEETKLRSEWEAKGQVWPGKEESAPRFDSNCITPGTPFMAHLADCLRYYVAQRLNTDPGWASVTVLLSDASVPGEGEHKIMDYIRRQRNMPEYDPLTHHVLYGLDADLIMLALATHEPHFKILREDVFFQEGRDRGCFICGQQGHMADSCTGKPKDKIGEHDEKSVAPQKPYVFLHVPILREYLEVELFVPETPFPWSLERAIDDWVFMCFFVGNDFLPHLPSLEIREGAIDTLIGLWKSHIKDWGGYLTNSGDIDLHRVEAMLHGLGELEDQVFRRRREIEERKRQARIERKRQARERAGLARQLHSNPYEDLPAAAISVNRSLEKQATIVRPPAGGSMKDNKAAAALLKASFTKTLVSQQETDKGTVTSAGVPADSEDLSRGLKRPIEEVDTTQQPPPETGGEEEEPDAPGILDEEEEEAPEEVDVPIPDIKPPKKDEDQESEPEDNVRLWESGWKERYYENKFKVDLSDSQFRKGIAAYYVEGLCWVLKYYYQGVQSWKWFYPYHYAPFASDFSGIGSLKIEFELGIPFKPIEQLMGVLPAASNSHIPQPFRFLMEDLDSPIIDFYPVHFPIDMNGKKHLWQGVALLPFIDEKRLLEAIEPVYKHLSPEEVKRNTKGYEIITVSSAAKCFDYLCSVYVHHSKNNETQRGMMDEKPMSIGKTQKAYFDGKVLPYEDPCFPGSTWISPLLHLDQPSIENNQTITTVYLMPEYPAGYKFKAELLKGVRFPPPVLDEHEKRDVRNNYHGRNAQGRRGRGRGDYRNVNSREAAGRFIKHGISVNPEAYGYDTREVNGQRSYYGQDNGHYNKRQRYDESRSYSNDRSSHNRQSSYSGGGYRPDPNYGNHSSHQYYNPSQSQDRHSYQNNRGNYSSSYQQDNRGTYNSSYQGNQGGYNYTGTYQSSSYTSQNANRGYSQNYQGNNGPHSAGGYSQSNYGASYGSGYQPAQSGLLNSLMSSSGYSNGSNSHQTSAYSSQYNSGNSGYASQEQSGDGEFRSQSEWAGSSGDASSRPPQNVGWNRNVSNSRGGYPQGRRGRHPR